MKSACHLYLLVSACLFSFRANAQNLFTLVPPKQSGVGFQNNIVESAEHNVLAYEYFYNGGGVAVGDLNNDGLPDIVFTANMDQPKVYLNKGHFVFEDISKKSKVRADGWKTGVTLADVNADGWLDIYICRSGNGDLSERRNLLFINQHDGTFKEMAADYGVDDQGNSTQAIFFDYDNDGDLDLFLLRHSIKRMKNFDIGYMKSAHDSLAGDRLYRNDGNNHFTNVTDQAGIISNPLCFGLGAVVADFNGDGWSDLYVSNDYDEDDYLYINQHDGTFKESVRSYMGHTSKFSMGCDVADVNNDGLTDLLTLDMLPESNRRQKLLKGPDGYDHFQSLVQHGYYYQYMRNMLHLAGRYGKDVRFSEVGQLAGVSNTDWSWSALFGDWDLDGRQDLFITNGYMRDYTNMDFLKYTTPEEVRKAIEAGHKPDLYDLVKKMPSSQVKSYLFKNTGDLGFENVSKLWGMDQASLSNGAAYGDFDNDGDWDLVVNNINQPAFIWQNHAEDLKNSYLKIRFAGDAKNPFGIGARVWVSASDGFQQLQELELNHGFESSSEPCLIFGLGKRQLVEVKVIWKNGKMQTLKGQAVNQTIVLNEKDAKEEIRMDANRGDTKDVNLADTKDAKIFTEISNAGIPFTHSEDEYNDFKKEPLLPRQYSRKGPALAVGDVDGDGRPDLFVSGGKGQAGAILVNFGDGKFEEEGDKILDKDFLSEGVEAVFSDLDHDGDLDLYVVSGGNESNFQDHIYWNDGRGNFSTRANVLPTTESSGGAVVAFDIDGDGYPEIFRGGQVKTGAYPAAPRSYLFKNEKGVLKDVTPDFLQHIGMVCAVQVADINKDGVDDLVLAGEFMPVTILFGQKNPPYFSEDRKMVIPNSSGWWNCLKIEDIDNDGDLDILAGNEGLNGQIKPSVTEPVTVDATDLDNNGTMDAILSYYVQGKSYPVATRDDLFDQVPSFKAKFPTYQSYCDATVQDIFTKEQWASALHLSAVEFRSGVFANEGGQFHFKAFPREAQAFPVRDLLTGYFTGGVSTTGGPAAGRRKDILLVGNDYATRAEWGRQDAGKGLLLAQEKTGGEHSGSGANAGSSGNGGGAANAGAGADPVFRVVPGAGGFHADKDARKMVQIGNLIIVANNNDKMQIFRIR
ncbi:MAG: FG-GAP-like repeat-containing protein [Puia sp.]|nr:FG-GAP-like repeat-containing protein [Puia sp.]